MSTTKTSDKAQPWTAQRENFHWLYKNIRKSNFLGLPYMVEPVAAKITLNMRPGFLVIKVGSEGKATFSYRNGSIEHSYKPYYVPSRDIKNHIDDFIAELRDLGYVVPPASPAA